MQTLENRSILTEQVFLARQPICDKELRTYGYELLFRESPSNQAVQDGKRAPAEVLMSALMEIGLDTVVGRHLAFINVTSSSIRCHYYGSLPKDRVVLQVSETGAPDKKLIDALIRLSGQGYKIALDDFVYHPSLESLLCVADFVKVDLTAQDPATLKEQLDTLQKFAHQRFIALRRFNVRLLAKKVETFADFDLAKSLGFDFFQGFFFCHPSMVAGKRVPNNRMGLLRLLSKLQDPEIQLKELEEVISQDLALSHKLLRYINSVFCGFRRKVESVRHAVSLVGADRIRMWTNLILFSGVRDKPSELAITSMIRARMCEVVAEVWKQEDTSRFFTVGLFSTLDALLDCPMEEALRDLPLSDEICRALVHREGLLGAALDSVLAYEQGDWDASVVSALTENAAPAAYLETLSWTQKTLAALSV